MLPTPTDNGARLAAILPTGIAAVVRQAGGDPTAVLEQALGRPCPAPEALPGVRSFVLIVVDGLGSANLQARRGHAPILDALPRKRLETVAPSTTGAALTTITTGRLPGEHGLIGYRIRHPELGLRTTLSEWEGIGDPSSWQLATPLLELARSLGLQTFAVGRPAHAHGGLTRAILSGAQYRAGQRIEDRFAIASELLRGREPSVVYLYIDELDRAAHHDGWESAAWVRRLEQFDAALGDLLRSIPGDVGIAITADHGIVDVPARQHVLLDARSELLDGVAEIGGEPRFRSLYLEPGVDPDALALRWQEIEGSRAWVSTRDAAVESGCFGSVRPEVVPRLGDVLIAARKRVAYYSERDSRESRSMIGQHGSFSEDERGIPLALAGALAGSGFVRAVSRISEPVPD